MKKGFVTISFILISVILGFGQDYRKIAEGNSKFAFSLYKEIKSEPVNMVYSPFSISSALGMTYAGAKNETMNDMAQALNFGTDQQAFHTQFGGLISQINNSKKGIKLEVANSLWIEKEMKIQKSFLKINKENYGSEAFNVDFSNDQEGSRQKINNWVEEKTNNMIEDFLSRGSILPSTRLVLVNAIYFKGNWAEPFKKERNTQDIFYIFSKCETKATFMHNSYYTGHYADKYMDVVELPYKGRASSMLIILPKERYGLPDVEKVMDLEKYQEIYRSFKRTKVKLSMPKFKFEATYDLNDPLKNLGMKSAFGSSADFSGITGSKDLFIDKVIHKAIIDVNETGTEAAAATGILMTKSAAPTTPLEVKIDHPFIFLIIDNETKSILFAGRVLNPNE